MDLDRALIGFCVCLSLLGCAKRQKPSLAPSAAFPADTLSIADSSFHDDGEMPIGIFFLRDWQLWYANTDGTGQRPVLTGGGGACDVYYWIPRANRIVAHLSDSLGDYVAIVDVDSGKEEDIHKIVHPPDDGDPPGISADYEYTLSASLNGDKIAYGCSFLEAHQYDLTVIYDASTKHKDTLKAFDAQLSPDGTIAAWAHDGSLYMRRLKEGVDVKLTGYDQGGAKGPANAIAAWSRDGHRLFYYCGSSTHENNSWVLSICEYDLRTQITKQISPPERDAIVKFLWESLDCHVIYYLIDRRRAPYDVTLKRLLLPSGKALNVEFPPSHSLTTIAASNSFFSPSLLGLAYESRATGGESERSIYVLDNRSRKSRRLIDYACYPVWRTAN
jgi:hypothetical protein